MCYKYKITILLVNIWNKGQDKNVNSNHNKQDGHQNNNKIVVQCQNTPPHSIDSIDSNTATRVESKKVQIRHN